VIGSAAALAVQWGLISIGKFRSTTSLEDTIFILSISIIAGFGSRRILPIITDQLEKQIKDTQKQVTNVKAELEETKKETKIVAEKATESDVVARALASLRPGAPKSELREIRGELETLLNLHPKDRTVAITLGRVCRADNDLKAAIDTLDGFLKVKEEAHEFDKDFADALYNRACYKAKLWEATRDSSYRDQAYQDLERSIKISPFNKVDAQGDEDFKVLWDEDKFKNLGIQSLAAEG
jgi:hypothetical protein